MDLAWLAAGQVTASVGRLMGANTSPTASTKHSFVGRWEVETDLIPSRFPFSLSNRKEKVGIERDLSLLVKTSLGPTSVSLSFRRA